MVLAPGRAETGRRPRLAVPRDVHLIWGVGKSFRRAIVNLTAQVRDGSAPHTVRGTGGTGGYQPARLVAPPASDRGSARFGQSNSYLGRTS